MNKKKKSQEKKTRIHAHGIKYNESHVTPGTNTVEMSLVLHDECGAGYAIVNNQRVDPSDFSISYMRPVKGPKTLVRFEHTGNAWTPGEYFNQYDIVIAIDTNTTTIAGKLFHVGFAIQPQYCKEHDHLLGVATLKEPMFLMIGERSKPENRHIRQLIEFLKITGFTKPNVTFEQLKFGIITDTDLGSIPDINKRITPLIDDYFIPSNVELIYASDAAADTLLNDLIKWCHKGANTVIDEYRKVLEPAPIRKD